MKLEVSVSIDSTPQDIWQVITDFQNCHKYISAIESIEVLNQPSSGLVGFKWKETRTMFGKEATEIMWITESKENEYYQTRAESHGSIYISRLSISQESGHCQLIMSFTGEFVTLTAKILGNTLGRLFIGATKKALLGDLEDIKTYIEARAS